MVMNYIFIIDIESVSSF